MSMCLLQPAVFHAMRAEAMLYLYPMTITGRGSSGLYRYCHSIAAALLAAT
jgi:hypothetical protein